MSATEEIIKTCFQDIISIKGGCGDIVSSSGLYSNDIDISVDFINEIVTRQYSGVKDFFVKKRDFAIKTVVDELTGRLTPKFRVGTLLDNFRIGQFQDNLKLIAGDGYLKGINFDLCNSDSYLNLFINEISLQVDKTGDVNVLVYDLIQNKLLDTITIACIADQVSTVYPAKQYFSDRRKLNLAFLYDSTGISSNTTYLKTNGCDSCSTGQSIVNPYEKINAVKILDSDAKIKSNLKILGETGGMSIVHSVSCNHHQWLCSYSNMMAMAILYQYGALVMEFARDVSPNDRINTSVTINAEEIETRRIVFATRYNKSIQDILDNIQMPSDQRCFHCRSGVVHAISTQ